METKQNGKIYYEQYNLSENHPLEFMLKKIDGVWEGDVFEEYYMRNEMICTYRTGVLHGLLKSLMITDGCCLETLKRVMQEKWRRYIIGNL